MSVKRLIRLQALYVVKPSWALAQEAGRRVGRGAIRR